MPLRTWYGSERKIKRYILFRLNCTFSAKVKLNLDAECMDLRVVMEKDGTEIDEDEALVLLKEQAFMILVPGQTWTKLQQVNISPLLRSKCSIFHKTFKTLTFQGRPKALVRSKGLTLPARDIFLRPLMMTFANNLDQDEAPQKVGPYLRSKLFDTRNIF